MSNLKTSSCGQKEGYTQYIVNNLQGYKIAYFLEVGSYKEVIIDNSLEVGSYREMRGRQSSIDGRKHGHHLIFPFLRQTVFFPKLHFLGGILELCVMSKKVSLCETICEL